jgi:hypothetical protein
MKTSREMMNPGPVNARKTTTGGTEQPLKICVVFDDDVSACGAQVLIRHVVSDYPCDTQSFRFNELDPPATGVPAARNASDTDILVVAVRDDRMLPAHVQSWLGLYMGLRDQDQEGALVVLVVKSEETPDPNSSLFEYLETIAAIGGFAFFPRRRGIVEAFTSDNEKDRESALLTAMMKAERHIPRQGCNRFGFPTE